MHQLADSVGASLAGKGAAARRFPCGGRVLRPVQSLSRRQKPLLQGIAPVKLRRGVARHYDAQSACVVTRCAPAGALVDGARSAQRGGRWPERLPQRLGRWPEGRDRWRLSPCDSSSGLGGEYALIQKNCRHRVSDQGLTAGVRLASRLGAGKPAVKNPNCSAARMREQWSAGVLI